MSSICDADLHLLKPGKKVQLKLFNGSLAAPENTAAPENYWQLIGTKAVVVSNDRERALITFERNLQSLGLISAAELPNSLWIAISDLKFVCRY